MSEIELTFCSDYLPKAYLVNRCVRTILPRKMWTYFIQNTTGEPNDSFTEIWVYASREAYDNGEDHVVLSDLSCGLYTSGVRDGNLLLFKTRNEAA